MRLLFSLDLHDYAGCTRSFVRDSARSIILRERKALMIRSAKYDYYKFPGGGIEPGEDPVAAMIRETREEAGLTVLPESVREYGFVHRIQRGVPDGTVCFIQDNYYYLCDVSDRPVPRELDDYEAAEGFSPEFVDPATVLAKNRSVGASPYDPVMFEREARVVELLLAEGYFD